MTQKVKPYELPKQYQAVDQNVGVERTHPRRHTKRLGQTAARVGLTLLAATTASAASYAGVDASGAAAHSIEKTVSPTPPHVPTPFEARRIFTVPYDGEGIDAVAEQVAPKGEYEKYVALITAEIPGSELQGNTSLVLPADALQGELMPPVEPTTPVTK